jgi:phosphate transport system substrate-binding protein
MKRPMIARHRALPGLILFAASLLILSCSRGSSHGEIIIAGSTSIQPFADRWAEAFVKEHKGSFINVQGGGSSAGIQAALSGAADVGMSSRDLKPDEKVLREIVVARDGLAIIVHPSNPVQGLRLIEVKQIFTGEIGLWKWLGGADAAITVVTREEGSGTRGAFQELVMGKSRISRRAIVQDSNGTVREIVAADPNAIGYISLGLVDRSVRALDLDGVTPGEDMIREGRYRLVRPFLFVTRGEPLGTAAEFIDFVLSPGGQDLARKEGLLTIR